MVGHICQCQGNFLFFYGQWVFYAITLSQVVLLLVRFPLFNKSFKEQVWEQEQDMRQTGVKHDKKQLIFPVNVHLNKKELCHFLSRDCCLSSQFQRSRASAKKMLLHAYSFLHTPGKYKQLEGLHNQIKYETLRSDRLFIWYVTIRSVKGIHLIHEYI